MDFSLTEEQKMLVQSAEQFAKKDSPLTRFRRLRAGETGWEKALWRKMGELGWLGIPFPESTGGFGGGLLEAGLVIQELGRALVPEPYLASVILSGMALAESGSKALQDKYLAPMIEGKISLALAYAEKESRFFPNVVATRAEAQGFEFILTGEKTWVLNGHAADALIVAARTSGKVEDEGGITLFVVDASAKGLLRKGVATHDGSHVGLVRLKGVSVSKDAAVGEVGKGLSILERALDRGAAMACCEGLGIIRECLSRTVDYLKVRQQFGVPIGSFQALQHRAADMFIEAQLAHSMAILASLKGADESDTERRRAVSAAKVQLAQSGWYVVRQAIQLHGGIGCTDEQDVGLFFKRMVVLNHLFGDEDYHLQRYSSLPGFEG